MAGIEDADLGIRDVAAIGRGAGELEGGVVSAPEHEERRMMAPEPFLPGRVALDIGPVVVEELDLDIRLPGAAEKGELVSPEIRVVEPRPRAAADMALPSCRQGQEILPQRRFMARAVRPEGAPGLP